MSDNNNPTQKPATGQHDWRAEARRSIRRKRILYTIIGIYAVLSAMWFVIDLADDSDSWWFYWPMFGVGIAVAIAAVVLLGVGGLFGTDWERREMERYRQRHGGTDGPD